ncbi:3-alpha,7-alpha,12-alpha-trihydroxy-5-beta-cholest-24-enoyl-CoA hydratase [Sphingomonas sp. Leaf357]|uniref:MaoC family dehydratase n=1 Tax=Sphingomonas sp. Leaf357 TaxID=1736350 RepID=UPI0006FEEB17|nr:MaoC family dehydratase [Sphingomonas sp. Leaf357]KQS03658.1 3-alpha,7-alpha,12-alpha-trihydroxy-5-beta-cholest-24-enoyl-CoA hydratase [Sphingomonas sp. Leaf357]
MTIDYAAAMALRDEGRRFDYADRETMLYALAAGMGRDPLDARELRYVFEGDGFCAMPTLAVVAARSDIARRIPFDLALMLHGEQRLTLHRPMPTAASLIADSRITEVLDKGEGKGALIYTETTARLADTDEPLFTIGNTLFARGDGGFGGPRGPAPATHALPDRAPDHVHVAETRADQALLYRLTGDRNPLHADPALARRAGFAVPILHGLCTYAIACRAVLATACEDDPARVRQFDVRFTAPVFPGDRIETDVWIDGDIVSFRCRVPERDVVAINNGRCVIVTP